ncbi:protein disulfide-isomerase domain [Kwoniella sp. DSM 27419]
MRLSSFAAKAFALCSLFLTLAQAASTEDDEFKPRQLTEDNFRRETKHGVWLVEHFSPKCGHCRAFAPTWERLAEDKRHLERLTGFHMAQVDCIAQGDLCNENGIKFYPQLVPYVDGEPLPHYKGDRSYADLSKFIEEHSNNYVQKLLSASDAEGDAEHSGRPNPDGKVVEVDEAALEVYKSAGPVFVDFYAPWCGHCKKLRPTVDTLGEEMKNKLNIVAVDCEAHKEFCRREGIMGYPTIRLYHHGTRTDHNGARSLDRLKDFAAKATQVTTLQSIKDDDFGDIVNANEAFFLYLQNFDTTVDDVKSVKSALEPLLGSVPAYTSADPALYKRLSIANPPPTSVLLAFSSHSSRPVGTVAFPASSEQIKRFINSHRFPTLVELSGSNYKSIMQSDTRAIVVLGALHKGDAGNKEKDTLAQVARAWKRGGREFQQPVWFAYVDGDKWAKWLKQQYGIRKSELPSVVVVDTPLSEYYDMTIEGQRLTFDGTAIFSVLEGIYQHFLRPKKVESTFAWGSRSASATLISLGQTTVEHPLLAVVLLVGAVALFVFMLQKCNGRDARENGHAGGSRLD